MKYTIVFISLLFLFLPSCNNQNKQSASTTDSLINTAGGNADSAYQKGARLIAANDCLTCHQVNKKSVGPSYYQISQKYHNSEGNAENLANSIVHGSQGLWGNTAMTPHPNITFADAKEIAKYILSLKNVPSTHPNK
jgi:cytochrome c